MLQTDKKTLYLLDRSDNCANENILRGFAVGHRTVSISNAHHQGSHSQSSSGQGQFGSAKSRTVQYVDYY
jgi:hypothetical protein